MIFIYSCPFFTIYGYIANSQFDQLPVGLIAQILFKPAFLSGFNFTAA